jgi:hypothetical protein
MGAVVSCIENVFAAIGSCIMAVVNAIAAVLKAIINVRFHITHTHTSKLANSSPRASWLSSRRSSLASPAGAWVGVEPRPRLPSDGGG